MLNAILLGLLFILLLLLLRPKGSPSHSVLYHLSKYPSKLVIELFLILPAFIRSLEEFPQTFLKFYQQEKQETYGTSCALLEPAHREKVVFARREEVA